MSAYLIHSGSKGMRWGVRRWQNKDGSLTPAGRERYGVGSARGEGSSGGSDASSSRKKKIKTALKVAAGVAIAAGAAYGGYRLSKNPAVRQALGSAVNRITNRKRRDMHDNETFTTYGVGIHRRHGDGKVARYIERRDNRDVTARNYARPPRDGFGSGMFRNYRKNQNRKQNKSNRSSSEMSKRNFGSTVFNDYGIRRSWW